MLRSTVKYFETRHNLPPHGSTVIVCDGCGCECKPSRYPDVDHGRDVGWAGLSAMAGAKSAGWTTGLVGRVQKDYCPKCAK